MAHVRIAELESSLSNKAQGQSLQINDAPQIPLTMEQNLDEQADFPALARKILSVRSSAMAPNFGAISADALQADRRALLTSAQSAQSHSSAVSSGSYPPFEVAQEAVEKFYLCNAISYPFLDKNDFMRDMDEAYARANSKENGQPGPLTSPEEEDLFKGKEFILFMVIAIGTTNRERMGEVERGSSKVFRDRAMKGLQAAISREDIVSRLAPSGGNPLTSPLVLRPIVDPPRDLLHVRSFWNLPLACCRLCGSNCHRFEPASTSGRRISPRKLRRAPETSLL